MPISFTCPHCGVTTQVADQFAGHSGPCKSCGTTIQVPFGAAASPSGTPAARSSSSTGAIILIVALIVIFGFLTVGGVLVALLLPAVQSAREAARRMSCSNNLKQVGLAMHNYHDVNGTFPPAYTVDAEGNKLHSWRTLLLPFLEQSALYDQIDLDKPWDAPENWHLADTVIGVYNCPTNAQNPSNHTNYMVIVGPGTVFEGPSPISFRDITDGTSNTLLVVEVTGQSTPWMAPDDLSLEQMQMAINSGATDPGSQHPGGINVAFSDGAVRFLASSLDSNTLKNLVTRADGEVVHLDY